jgi:beta-galactosidase
MYVPGPWLKKGRNEVIVLDLEATASPTLAGLDKPILDDLRPDASLLNRKPGQQLKLDAETPHSSGDLAPGAGWQTVTFDTPATGRYLCFTSTSPQRGDDPYSSMAEFYLLGEDGQQLPREAWDLVYADSEEITAGNHTADKIFDLQESTYWHTAWSTEERAPFPHSIVIDLGKSTKVTGFKVLPRTDKQTNGMIKGYRFYLKESAFDY